MSGKILKLVVIGLLINFTSTGTAHARPGERTSAPTQGTSQQSQEEQYKKQVVDWGTNKPVSVRLKSGDRVEGRIAGIRDDVFTVQMVEKGKVTSRDVRYSEVRSLKEKNGRAGKIVGYTTLGILAGVGVTFLVILAIVAAND
ncbi:MAG TPA: hypothetical protein VFD58_12465 [Blastocatellia bacterium]|nr:hypothetical protein [Blastocatellia bacterium]